MFFMFQSFRFPSENNKGMLNQIVIPDGKAFSAILYIFFIKENIFILMSDVAFYLICKV